MEIHPLKILHLCKMETKTKSNHFKMLKSMHKSKTQQDLWSKTHLRRSCGEEKEWGFRGAVNEFMKEDVDSGINRH